MIENPLTMYQMAALLLLALGIFCMVWRRTLVGLLIGVELMINGAGMSITAAGQLTEASGSLAQLATLLVMGMAAAEATLALAIILVVLRRFGKAKTNTVATMRH